MGGSRLWKTDIGSTVFQSYQGDGRITIMKDWCKGQQYFSHIKVMEGSRLCKTDEGSTVFQSYQGDGRIKIMKDWWRVNSISVISRWWEDQDYERLMKGQQYFSHIKVMEGSRLCKTDEGSTVFQSYQGDGRIKIMKDWWRVNSISVISRWWEDQDYERLMKGQQYFSHIKVMGGSRLWKTDIGSTVFQSYQGDGRITIMKDWCKGQQYFSHIKVMEGSRLWKTDEGSTVFQSYQGDGRIKIM